MNKRIEELAERATEEMNSEAFSEDMNIPTEWYHKFAELIVKECISVVYDQRGTDLGSERDFDIVNIALKIDRHFGVEE